MPNRIIKESAFTSDRIAALTDFEFRLWVGLITQADDAGRGDARPAIIKGRVFALRERTTVTDIDKALHALAACGCVDLYDVDGKPYYEFPSWAKHQRVREIKSKYPARGDLPQVAANCGELPPESNPIQSNPIQSESEYKSESKSKHIEDPFAALAGDDMDLMEALHAYAEMRKRIKKPLTERARGVVCKKLAEFPREKWVQIVDQATEKCWLGFYPLEKIKTDTPERPASYDIKKAETEMKTTVPELKKRGRKNT